MGADVAGGLVVPGAIFRQLEARARHARRAFVAGKVYRLHLESRPGRQPTIGRAAGHARETGGVSRGIDAGLPGAVYAATFYGTGMGGTHAVPLLLRPARRSGCFDGAEPAE